jgi:heat shock protein HtpX
MKRITLFILTNLGVVLLLALIAKVTGLDSWLVRRGSGLGSLLGFAALLGFSGAFVSLAMSKSVARRAMGVRIIDVPATASERWLLETVQILAREAGIGIPEVGIFDSAEPNAFATGPRRNAALVAVSSSLLSSMSRSEIAAVLGHELTHVANGDMVTLALLQGVVNTFVMLLSRIVGNIVDRSLTRDNDGCGPAYFVTVLITQAVLGVLASVVVLWFSRQREFRADAGGARLAGRDPMIAALERLQRAPEQPLPAQLSAFGIAGGDGTGWRGLFLSHPPMAQRIAALRALDGALWRASI